MFSSIIVKTPSDDEQPEDDNKPFEWPVSSPPTAQNLVLASRLCATLMGPNAPRGITTSLQNGWSTQDCIRVDFSSASSSSSSRSFIVKVPRERCVRAVSMCKAEATRTTWAGECSIGPKVFAIDDESGAFAMECIMGENLTIETALRSLPQTIELLLKIHKAPALPWMRIHNPIAIVQNQLQCAKNENLMLFEDVRFLESVMTHTKNEIKDFYSSPHRLVPCHNDFHCQNIMLEQNNDQKNNRAVAIDFENLDLGDPMWDFAYLTVNLDLERQPLALADLCGATMEERRRLRAYCPLAMAHCATWAGIHGLLWRKYSRGLIVRMRQAMADWI